MWCGLVVVGHHYLIHSPDSKAINMEDKVGHAKSRSDRKDYRLLTLHSGLEVLLVSTEKLHSVGGDQCTKSSAAMTVQVGSFADPSDCEGLAHFLEHMIFMGRY